MWWLIAGWIGYRHHLNAPGQLRSVQYPCLKPDKIVQSVTELAAMETLHTFADLREDNDLDMVIRKRPDAIADVYVRLMGRLNI